MAKVGKTVTTYQEYLERCIKAAAKGMAMCASDPMKLAELLSNVVFQLRRRSDFQLHL